MRISTQKLRWLKWLGSLLWLLLPFLIGHMDYVMHIVIFVAMFTILSLSLNLNNGMAGQLNLGHAAFFGIGAYVVGLLTVDFQWSFWAALPVAIVASSLMGFLVGLPSLRVGGSYLGIVTLGFGEILRLVLLNWDRVTHGPMGITAIPGPALGGLGFSGKTPYFYLITIMAALTWFTMDRLIASKFGLQCLALRKDERAALALGVNVGRVKVLSFVIAAGFAGLAGTFYASYISFISPDSFLYNDSIIILSMVVLGGMGSPVGSIIGAILLTAAPEALRFMGDWRMILYGILLTIMVVWKPSGIWGLERRVRNAINVPARG